jgi:hypothetical protein
MDDSKRKKVLCPISKDGKTYWMKLGVAFVNQDNSINVYLDGLPTNGKLQVRDWDDGPSDRRGGYAGSARGRDDAAPTPVPQDDLPF